MPTALHETAVSWMRKEFNLWVYGHLLTPEAIEAITDALITHDHFLGEFSGAERRPGAVKIVILFKLYRSRLHNRIKATLTFFRYVAGRVPAMSFYNSRWAKPGNTARIDVYQFGNLLISSGLVMYDDVKWISFHSGYDFGYLVKIMSCLPLPMEESEFRNLLSKYFPALYNIKFLVKSCPTLKVSCINIYTQRKSVGP
ncbi:ribonuclease H-like protein [Tuber magnatum]|uniref:Ribonuclease H-like protein n=1 Tax=Tuber magnatum TaxID=42249 RepID=A0A317SW52_9PEZI|nr:ribonuclease H-like protein [Tuber magnatum]